MPSPSRRTKAELEGQVESRAELAELTRFGLELMAALQEAKTAAANMGAASEQLNAARRRVAEVQGRLIFATSSRWKSRPLSLPER